MTQNNAEDMRHRTMKSMSQIRTVRCPQCGKPVEWTPASKFRPFCSERCKTLDFGAWASETYRIPAVEADDETDDPAGGTTPPPR
jgi:endogenous inhibitor of DNA gyrase (YacG/DUF329 family)